MNNALEVPPHNDPIARAALIVIALAVVASAIYPTVAVRAAVAQATPEPVIILATATASLPAAESLVAYEQPAFAAALTQEIDVYGAPDGNWIGKVEAGRAFTPKARRAGDWVQLDVDGSGLVWAAVASVPGVAIGDLPDVAPPPPAAPIVQAQYSPPAPEPVNPVELVNNAVSFAVDTAEQVQQTIDPSPIPDNPGFNAGADPGCDAACADASAKLAEELSNSSIATTSRRRCVNRGCETVRSYP